MSSEKISGREFAKRAGCDVKQVQRAIKSGRLSVDEDKLLDASQLNSGWRKPIRTSKNVEDTLKVSSQVSSPKVSSSDEDETPAQIAERLVRELGATFNLAQAIQIKENFNARLKQLEYEQKSGLLIELAVAESAMFDCARQQRDSWLNWPTRVAPLIAAQLGVEADKMTEILTAYVHEHITKLAGSEVADFTGRKT